MQRRSGLVTFIAMVVAVPASAQVVQLPTFHVFSVNTSVTVPDRGGIQLGGHTGSIAGSVSRGAGPLGKIPGIGPFVQHRAAGAAGIASGTHITTTIIDHGEWDRAVLSRAAGLSSTNGWVGKAEFLSRNVARSAGGADQIPGGERASRRAASIAAIRAANRQQAQRQRDEAQGFVDKGLAAERNGRTELAVQYYKMAARRSGGEYQRKVLQRIAQLTGQPN